MPDFLTLGILPAMNQALQANGMTKPTPIQEKAIPVVLTGKDIIAQAQTGTGKTLAFVLPILQMVDPTTTDVQALIVTPTRELALQITTEVKKLTTHLPDVHVLAIYGGQEVDKQLKRLKGNKQIVIATPGRLLDHLRRGTIQLSHVSMLVLDEADQMLHMGFLPDVEQIIQRTSPTRQTMLFSATMPQPIRSLATSFMRKPEEVRVSGSRITLERIKQVAVETTDRNKQATIRQMLDEYRPFLAIIFCRTKRRANALNEALLGYGYNSEELHGDLSQAKREGVMKRFREAKIQFLVATDVAARGLDVEGVTHVFNYDIPQDVESYIHRIGRTGRAGDTGLAITLVAPKDRVFLEQIEKGINQSIERQNVNVELPHDDTTSVVAGRESRQPKERKYDPKRGEPRRAKTGRDRMLPKAAKTTTKKPALQTSGRRGRK